MLYPFLVSCLRPLALIRASLPVCCFATLMIAAAEPGVALVGDTTAADAELARHVLMVLRSGRGSAGFCSGVLLDRQIVLTAAHCVASPQDTKIYNKTDGQTEFASILEIAIHPLYRPKAPQSRERSIDLALLRLDHPLTGMAPTAWAQTGSVSLGATVRIAGFGVTREQDGRSGGVLRAGMLVVRAPVSTILLWLDDPTHHGTGACAGDSGGPVFTDRMLTAIVNWAEGSGAAHCGTLTQAALLAPQRQWIEGILRAWAAR
jgi:hypothetical protein